MKRFAYLCFLVGVSIFSSSLVIEFVSNGTINIDLVLDAIEEGIGYGVLGGCILKIFDNFPDTTDRNK